jgi:Zn-dependent protease/predicted transcriptional regulator
MQTTFRLVRVAGIEIGISWTWSIVFSLVAVTLALSVFPAQNPGLSDVTYWGMALVAALLFFTSILLHELGHALVAKRNGVEIEGITLWLLGGVAKLKTTYRTAGAEFRITAAGPLVTLVIASALLLLGGIARLPSGVDGVVIWLGLINALVLLFNLLPALPLDGGRLLHAALWWRRGDQDWATRVAAGIGQGFGFVLLGGGVVLVLTGDTVGGIWLGILGWFLRMAAGTEASVAATREALAGLRVNDLMSEHPVTAAADLTLGSFVDEIARATRFVSYPVVADGRPLGLLSFQRVLEVPRGEWDRRHVEDVMMPRDDVLCFAPEDVVGDVLERLLIAPIHRALVLEDDRLVGILSVTDVTRAVEAGRREQRRPSIPAPDKIKRRAA